MSGAQWGERENPPFSDHGARDDETLATGDAGAPTEPRQDTTNITAVVAAAIIVLWRAGKEIRVKRK